MYNGAKPTVDKTDTRTILHVDKDGFENFSTMAGGTGDRVYLEFTTSEPSEVVTTIYVPISQVIDSYENGDTMETQSGGISVFIQDGTSSNDLRIQFDYMKPGIDYSIALYAEMGDLADTVYND